MVAAPKDPRSDAEKARVDLVRNSELGLSVPESPIEQQPSVTPATFGETSKAARLRSGNDQGLEAGGELPEGEDRSPESVAEAEQRMAAACNAKTRLSGRLLRGEAELVAQGVGAVQGQPGRCNVYLIEDDGGITIFDAEARSPLGLIQ